MTSTSKIEVTSDDQDQSTSQVTITITDDPTSQDAINLNIKFVGPTTLKEAMRLLHDRARKQLEILLAHLDEAHPPE